MIQVICAGATDVGEMRAHNEDYFCFSEGSPSLCIVADGMAGGRGGDLASKLATQTVVQFFHKSDLPIDPELWLKLAIQKANEAVIDATVTNPRYRGMGSTMVCALFIDENVWFAHVGDSRAYRIRDGRLHRKTADHTLQRDYVQRGLLKIEDIDDFPYKNVITRLCGFSPDIEVEISSDAVETDDLYILCTDGLTELVSEEEIFEITSSSQGDIEQMCQELLVRANLNGGTDNITVVVAKATQTAELP